MSEQRTTEITNYIDFLRNNQRLYVTIHIKNPSLTKEIYKIILYNVHKNPYCLYLKYNEDVREHCRLRQCKIYEKCNDGIFYGMCYAGVEEYVIPLNFEDEFLGFISISGYCTSPEKSTARIHHVCRKYLLDPQKTQEIFMQNMQPKPPDIDYIKTITAPLVRMLELFYLQYIKENSLALKISSGSEYILEHTIDFIERNFRNNINLDDISRTCHSSRSHISHLFKKNIGCGISTFINQHRIEEAKRLLVQTKLSIQDISQFVGFSDSNYFSNTFKKQTGVAPSEYRKNNL